MADFSHADDGAGSGLGAVSPREHRAFRVRGKIFATVPDEQCIRIMVDEHEILAATAAHPDACRPVYWGKRLSCVAVDIAVAPDDLIRELLTEAWLRKAPVSLTKLFTRSE